jgi:hypothetical protein
VERCKLKGVERNVEGELEFKVDAPWVFPVQWEYRSIHWLASSPGMTAPWAASQTMTEPAASSQAACQHWGPLWTMRKHGKKGLL